MLSQCRALKSCFFKLCHYFYRAFPCSICLFNTAHLVNTFSPLSLVVKNNLPSSRRGKQYGDLQPLKWPALQLYEWWTALALDWAELKASGTHCYGNITLSVFTVHRTVQWGNACDVTLRETGEGGICTTGGSGGGNGTNVCQTTTHDIMEETESEGENHTNLVTKFLKSSPSVTWVFVHFLHSVTVSHHCGSFSSDSTMLWDFCCFCFVLVA